VYKRQIHGNEWTSGSSFFESSYIPKSVSKYGDARQMGSNGPPNDTRSYWSFDGSGDYLEVPASTDFSLGTDKFVLEMWVQATSTGSMKTLAYLGESGGTPNISFHLYRDANDYINFDFYDTNGQLYKVKSSKVGEKVTADGKWHRVMAARDNYSLILAIGKKDDAKIEIASTTPMISTTSLYSLNQPLQIGQGNSANYWAGYMNEIILTIGTPLRWKNFITPTIVGLTNIEGYRIYKLPPGVVFERLYRNGVSKMELNVAWRVNEASHWPYTENLSVATSSVVINHAGAEGADTDRDTPATIEINEAGLFTTNGF